MADGTNKPEMRVAIGIVRWEDQFLVGPAAMIKLGPGVPNSPAARSSRVKPLIKPSARGPGRNRD